MFVDKIESQSNDFFINLTISLLNPPYDWSTDFIFYALRDIPNYHVIFFLNKNIRIM